MNIFVLDVKVDKCAEYHCDKHVVKMVLESAQILCTALVINGVDEIDVPYKPTHKHHPCVKWAANSYGNWKWLYYLMEALNNEYKYRYDHIENHKAFQRCKDYQLITRLSNEWYSLFENCDVQYFIQCMPEKYKISNSAVEAYRTYYQEEKYKIAKWTRRNMPHWWCDFQKLTEEDINVL